MVRKANVKSIKIFYYKHKYNSNYLNINDTGKQQRLDWKNSIKSNLDWDSSASQVLVLQAQEHEFKP